MIIKQTRTFKNGYKKTKPEQLSTINDKIKLIAEDTTIGESLKGDFAQIRKFETISYILSQDTIILLSVES